MRIVDALLENSTIFGSKRIVRFSLAAGNAQRETLHVCLPGIYDEPSASVWRYGFEVDQHYGFELLQAPACA